MFHTHLLSLLAVLLLPVATAGEPVPAEQDFVVTAYYSPLPDQCCYVRGSYAADVELNGSGVSGADGTDVYPGMAAAPASLPFGTRISLPGVGVVTVHDRGGAIRDLAGGARRLDLWLGVGEEGLARALAFGVRRVRGTIHPVSGAQPAESFALQAFASPQERLRPYVVAGANLLSLAIGPGDRTYSVKLFQQALARAGSFSDAATGFFGPVTQRSWDLFRRDLGLPLGTDVSVEALAYLQAAAGWTREFTMPRLHAGRARGDVAAVQRTLRFLGYYRGRTDGVYDDRLVRAIRAAQIEGKLVASERDPGAGRLGPRTRALIAILWKRKHLASRARSLLAFHRIDRMLSESAGDLARTLERGDRGEDVSALQRLLAAEGIFDPADVNGQFGEKTERAVTAFQLRRGIIATGRDRAAGHVGPATLATLRSLARERLLRLVRAEGWGAL